nr:succinyl-diaminopimelate desuccinylase [Amorphus orientalis]
MDVCDPVAVARALIACPSVTPEEGGALDLLERVLDRLGFSVTRLTFSEPGTAEVDNLVASLGTGAPHLLFAGHTDVVPPGDSRTWRHPPFSGEIDDGFLYGRGAVDMKGGVAAFVAAIARLKAADRLPVGTITLVITGDEEGPGINGTQKALAWCADKGFAFDGALVGEPTCVARLGDMAKIGRRGSLSGTIRVQGRQGHAAYPHRALNPMAAVAPIARTLAEDPLDEGTSDFQPSNLELVSIDTDNSAFNVIPGACEIRFNVRFNTIWSSDTLKAELLRRIEDATPDGISTQVEWERPSEPFVTESGALADAMSEAISQVVGARPELSTSGGTSDARYVRAYCPVVEFGLVGDTMHQIDERVPLADLEGLTEIYGRFTSLVLAGGGGAAGT